MISRGKMGIRVPKSLKSVMEYVEQVAAHDVQCESI